jgi:hypothetical protein
MLDASLKRKEKLTLDNARLRFTTYICVHQPGTSVGRKVNFNVLSCTCTHGLFVPHRSEMLTPERDMQDIQVHTTVELEAIDKNRSQGTCPRGQDRDFLVGPRIPIFSNINRVKAYKFICIGQKMFKVL